MHDRCHFSLLRARDNPLGINNLMMLGPWEVGEKKARPGQKYTLQGQICQNGPGPIKTKGRPLQQRTILSLRIPRVAFLVSTTSRAS
jgi:hypothetical protein